jgi:hypothetical protein
MTFLHTLYIFTIFRKDVMLFFLKKKKKRKRKHIILTFYEMRAFQNFSFGGNMLYGKYTNNILLNIPYEMTSRLIYFLLINVIAQ